MVLQAYEELLRQVEPFLPVTRSTARELANEEREGTDDETRQFDPSGRIGSNRWI